MIAYLTSNPEGKYKVDGKKVTCALDESNGFVESLRKHWWENSKGLIIASAPDDIEMNDNYDNYPEEKLNNIMNINLYAPIEFIKEVSKSMIECKSGRIVNTASIAGQIGHPDIWHGVSKAGIINATKSFAKILGPKGIIINLVESGPVETEMMKVIPQARKQAIKSNVYLDGFAKAEEVAKTIFWLATESPEYINDTCIDINNGAFPR